jgi:predicted phage baseplate assembly protein
MEKANIQLQGGRRIRDVKVINLTVHRQSDPTLDDFMEVQVSKPGDFSAYTLSVVGLDGFDARYGQVKFSFKAACPTGLDCKTQNTCPPPDRTQPHINYLAKDYASLRQLILDRLAFTMPQWQETHVPDLEITLVELLAYAGDYLSYYQDAVATEAYLGTARQRVSVRRHARLVDYQMHDGCNARAWVTVSTDTDIQFDASTISFVTQFPSVPPRSILTAADLVNVAPSAYDVFQPLLPASGTVWFYRAHSEIYFYTWGDCQCCLAKGATSATLIDYFVDNSTPASTAKAPGRKLNLKPGDVLIFEEVLGPKTANPSDADPTHRQAVRLTSVTQALDPLYPPKEGEPGQPIVEIEWAAEDALTFTLCISTQAPSPACNCLEDVSVARGNVVLVDNGGSTSETIGVVSTESFVQKCATACTPAETTITPAKFCPVLTKKPLTFSQPLPACGSATALIAQDPRQAVPDITLSSIPPAPACTPMPAPAPPCQIPPLFTFNDLSNLTSLARTLKAHADLNSAFLYGALSATTRQALAAYDGTSALATALEVDLSADLKVLLETWSPLRDLLESGPEDLSFVAEMDDDGRAHLRFGDSNLGQIPDAGTAFRANYRTGNGTAGNVGAESIRYIVLKETLSGVNLQPRNPLAASGGTDPEPVAEVKLFAPNAFRDVLERAITVDDYATLAADNARRLEERADRCSQPFRGLQSAKAVLRWNGSWYTALVALDPLGTEQSSPGLIHEVTKYLEPYRRVGHDLLVAQAEYVALDLALTICVLPGYLRAHVESALLNVFSNRVLSNGGKGFFHPDNLSFGEGIFTSTIIAAAQAVAGVQNVTVTRLERWELIDASANQTEAAQVPPNSVLTLGPLEIARLDNDPNFPENGRLSLDVRGGR